MKVLSRTTLAFVFPDQLSQKPQNDKIGKLSEQKVMEIHERLIDFLAE